jgi:ANTAR domain
MVDLTTTVQKETEQIRREAVEAANVHRGVIEQARGILMGAFKADADEAFRMLIAGSNQTAVAPLESCSGEGDNGRTSCGPAAWPCRLLCFRHRPRPVRSGQVLARLLWRSQMRSGSGCRSLSRIWLRVHRT